MSTIAEVRLWGRRIGAVALENDSTTTTFEYDSAFIHSGIEVAPLTMPLTHRVFTFPALSPLTFHGLPGLLADSLPDRFGNALIEVWLADHVKNIAFLMDKSGQWSLSPAFDMTYSFQPTGQWTSRHQMTLNGKQDHFELKDFKDCAKTIAMKRGRAKVIIDEVREVVRHWPDYADNVQIPPLQRDKIQSTLRLGTLH